MQGAPQKIDERIRHYVDFCRAEFFASNFFCGERFAISFAWASGAGLKCLLLEKIAKNSIFFFECLTRIFFFDIIFSLLVSFV